MSDEPKKTDAGRRMVFAGAALSVLSIASRGSQWQAGPGTATIARFLTARLLAAWKYIVHGGLRPTPSPPSKLS